MGRPLVLISASRSSFVLFGDGRGNFWNLNGYLMVDADESNVHGTKRITV